MMKDNVQGMSGQTDIQKEGVKTLGDEDGFGLKHYRPLLPGERLVDTGRIMATMVKWGDSNSVMIYYEDKLENGTIITKWMRFKEEHALELARNILKKYADGKSDQTA
jgi:hypothetical protein